jgi:hypothetical protein
VEQARALDEENSQDRQQPEIIDLTDDNIQDSQAPRSEKRRKISHGPNPTAEEETPEKKPRKVGTVESARFQSVSTVGQQEKPYEIKDSYEEEQELGKRGLRLQYQTASIETHIPKLSHHLSPLKIPSPPNCREAPSRKFLLPHNYRLLHRAISTPLLSGTRTLRGLSQILKSWDRPRTNRQKLKFPRLHRLRLRPPEQISTLVQL